jgi:hypothetical protein
MSFVEESSGSSASVTDDQESSNDDSEGPLSLSRAPTSILDTKSYHETSKNSRMTGILLGLLSTSPFFSEYELLLFPSVVVGGQCC